MRRLRKYGTVWLLTVQDAMTYRLNFVISWLINLYTLLIPLAMWAMIFRETPDIAGYNAHSMTLYLVVIALLKYVVLADGIHYTIAGDIESGKLNQYLNKPVHYFAYMFFVNAGRRSIQFALLFIPLVVLLPGLTAAGLLAPDALPQQPGWAVASALLGLAISFLIFYCLGLVAFWFVRYHVLFIFFSNVYWFLSGMWFPPDVFASLEWLFRLVPFPYQVYFTAKICTNGLTERQIVEGIGCQLLWIGILSAVSYWIWRKGVKSYQAVGG
ncbi:ABC transporter permease [Paenibacillus oleatilyticus]|uniref:ABC transporter permease n=1 Tax=Paenibacillus oleatilyticus TaxID=2594886 RepID=UPI001C1FA4B8|nr:ABC-2 family transporter protein [Paenibacillus oleatilyticus]MBU7316745.1 ABC-2 family transporter protein [Paenibacillus oleatilyticus]